MKTMTVATLKEELERLCAKGLGDRVVSFPKDDDDDYEGDFILIAEVDTKDALEVAVYLTPHSAEDNNAIWAEVEAIGEARLEEEDA